MMVPNMAALCVIDVSDDNGLAALNIPFADSGHGSTGDDDSRCEGRKEGRKEGRIVIEIRNVSNVFHPMG